LLKFALIYNKLTIKWHRPYSIRANPLQSGCQQRKAGGSPPLGRIDGIPT
jgi:hypothetical protein